MTSRQDDDDGTMLRTVTLTEDGQLRIEGHDRGAGVEKFFHHSEYEYERRLSADDVARLRELLRLADEDDLLAAISARFDSNHALEQFLIDNGIEGSFWSRIGG
ncbi:hypothetical protein ACPXB3_21120 [Gordonia sp. DT219]|uniref:hypothetical protein n=1 Tax=Gordonia sp. DT219 TaxID=3416658 RepID=UPI003CF002E7